MIFPLFETIAIENGQPKNLALHQQRYEKSVRSFYRDEIIHCHDFKTLIVAPRELQQGLVRCRIDYNHTADYSIQYFPYVRRHFRRFKVIECDSIQYDLKYAQRETLNNLYAQRGDCDEVIIVKNGLVTDCTIGNLIFRRQGQWLTPDTPLLEGTQRQKLMQERKIVVQRIYAKDIERFEEIRVINALNPL